jgi:uncharacterized membrane protein
MSSLENPEAAVPKKHRHPFRRALLRGLAIVMPPLLTIVLFIWAWTIIEGRVLEPVERGLAWSYVSAVSASWLADAELMQVTPDERIDWVLEHRLTRGLVLPGFLSTFILVLYLLGKFVAAPVGRMIVNSFDTLINRLPLISNVYSSVKQVTDFFLTEREIEFNRVVAVEYPRRGVWSVGFVTGESMLDIRSAANEPVLSVLMPTSPMPATGFTITVRKSEVVDLDLTIDQAIQFVVSCGVVVPRHQQQTPEGNIALGISAAIAQHAGGNGEADRKQEQDERTTAGEAPSAQD